MYDVAQRTGLARAGSETHHLPSNGTEQVAEEIFRPPGLIFACQEDWETWFEYWRSGLEENDRGVLYT